ncbi:MAG: hypothetical protein Q9191_002660 [Dirinaria sp. TL-2023a]
MFRFHKTLDVITLFHRPSAPSSLRVLTQLKQLSAHASETATEDQATDHTHQNKLQRTQFELNVTEEPPTSDQVRTILEYVGERKASQLVDGARDAKDAIRKLKEDSRRFKVPVVRPEVRRLEQWQSWQAPSPKESFMDADIE